MDKNQMPRSPEEENCWLPFALHLKKGEDAERQTFQLTGVWNDEPVPELPLSLLVTRFWLGGLGPHMRLPVPPVSNRTRPCDDGESPAKSQQSAAKFYF